MVKKGGVGNGSSAKPAPVKYQPAALRQPSGGGGAAVTSTTQGLNPTNQARALRVDHLLRISTWASANVPPLGALLGARLGHLCEAAGVPVPESPHSTCQRCESVMQVGVNCSVRVTKPKKSKRPCSVSNYVTSYCHFCNYANARPGTSKTHLKTKLAQAAARSNLNLLGKSSVAEQQALSLDLVKKEKKQQGVVESKRAVQVCLENLQGVSQQEGSEAVEMTLDTETLPDISQQEGFKAVEVMLDTETLQGVTQQEGLEAVEVLLDRETLNVRENNQSEKEGAVTVDLKFNKGPLENSGKDEQGLTQQEGVKSSTEMSVRRLPLDLSSKKKRKKKNKQGGVVEQQGLIPNTSSPRKGLAVDSAQKKKRKGWSTLKELASLP